MSASASRLTLTVSFLLAACGDVVSLEAAPPLARAEPAACVPPPECGRITTIGFQLDTCCTEALACGLDLRPSLEHASLLEPEIREQVFPPELSEANWCLHPSRLFVPVPGPEEERVKVRGAADILLTPECDTYNMFSFPLPGCCLPTGRCGVSSHFSISNLIPFVAPGSEAVTPQCLSPAEFRRQLRGSAIERIAQPPEIAKTCSHAALDARLPQAPEPPPPEPDIAPEDRQ